MDNLSLTNYTAISANSVCLRHGDDPKEQKL